MTEDQKEAILKVLDYADNFVWNEVAEEEGDELADLEFDEHRGDELDGMLASMVIHMLKIKHGVSDSRDADRVYPDGDGGWVRPGA